MKTVLLVLLAASALEVASDPQRPSIEVDEKATAVDDKVTEERWSFTFDGRPWQLASADLNGSAVIRTYVPEGRSLADTEERLVTEYGKKGNPHILFDQLKAGLAEVCPTLEILPISEEKDSILFEWSCAGSLAQHSLKKLTRTPSGIFTLGYSRKGRMSAEEKKTWLAILTAAEPQ